ncbi:hypothetical protein C8R42DRAFT_724301 [Lentinula raphanica]|nr:hypothetical protein C8R42DRAFT_724301 [Lentinula raphanica]
MTTPRGHFWDPLRVITTFCNRYPITHRYFLQKFYSISCVWFSIIRLSKVVVGFSIVNAGFFVINAGFYIGVYITFNINAGFYVGVDITFNINAGFYVGVDIAFNINAGFSLVNAGFYVGFSFVNIGFSFINVGFSFGFSLDDDVGFYFGFGNSSFAPPTLEQRRIQGKGARKKGQRLLKTTRRKNKKRKEVNKKVKEVGAVGAVREVEGGVEGGVEKEEEMRKTRAQLAAAEDGSEEENVPGNVPENSESSPIPSGTPSTSSDRSFVYSSTRASPSEHVKAESSKILLALSSTPDDLDWLGDFIRDLEGESWQENNALITDSPVRGWFTTPIMDPKAESPGSRLSWGYHQ